MPDQSHSRISFLVQQLQKWGLPASVFLYQLIALVTFAIVPFFASQYLATPFIGGFIEHTLIVSSTTPSHTEDWALADQGSVFGNQVISINGEAISSIFALQEILRTYTDGDHVELQIKTLEGNFETVRITLSRVPAEDRFKYLVMPYMIGLIYLGCGIWVFTLRRRDAAGRAFIVFSTSVAITMAAFFDMSTTSRLTLLWTFALAMAGGSLINLAMLFPQEARLAARYPALPWVGYLGTLILSIFAFPSIYNLSRPTAYAIAWRWEYIFAGLGIVIFLFWTAWRFFTSSFPVVREQARLILIGSGLAFLPLGSWFFITALRPEIKFSPYLMAPIVIFPIFTAYTILRYRLLRTDYLISRAIIYGLLTVLIVGGYALLASGLALMLGNKSVGYDPILTGLILFILAIALIPLRNALQRFIDKAFARSQSIYREILLGFGRELTQAMDLPTILKILRQYIDGNLKPSQVHIYTHDPLSDHYVASPNGIPAGTATSDVRFSMNSALAQALSKQRNSLFLGEFKSLPASLQADQTRIALLGAQLFVPLPGRQKLSGWLALGQRRSGEPYNNRDLEFLESLCDQAALAIERAQVVADLERRVHAMNVLTRVSQGVNVTVSFDDILELIYAQTNNVIPTRDYWISLYDSGSDFLYHVFYLEHDERLTEEENNPIPIGQGLEREVLKLRRAIVTDDYERECRSRGSLPALQGFFAWAGVPLNTGAETIGVISLASRDAATVFTDEQINLLQAIADQAAGAIIKARLMQDSEHRARQLATLNEVARSLSSTLEIEPLLNQILTSAVDILNCEAGSLLLKDKDTDEMVFEVVVGPVASDLLGKRLQAGTGLVGKAVDNHQAYIQNDVRRSKEWFDDIEEQTGFQTRDLLVVPMMVKEQVSGVIEVINRKDGKPFTKDDQELLMAFTSQAAVALDNARLYTQTDETLADRVEELSVMQRIDRELNASLDVSRAMRITLEWAMRRSVSDAGLIGIKEAENIHIMASQGYATELEDYPSQLLPIEQSPIQVAIETGAAQSMLVNSREETDGSPSWHILADCQSQIIVPIRREAEVIGILLLESKKGDTSSEDTQAFLSRLSDHAAIAISNAQLYSAVQAANLAKSDFVSFVSHELKTPMTSIRGFTDLLAAGVVGQINEAQGNFLTTIRSNVDRMATLVSDLADVSRIEAGRLRLDYQAVPLGEMVEEIIRSARAQIEAKEQMLEVNIPGDLPAMWGDRNRLIQVLTNLVNNAHKYTPQGGKLLVNAEVSENTWDPEGAATVIHISVKDTGIGISPENQAKIFQKFFRADDQKVRDIPGTGLGLNITKTLVEMQGGQIWFESVVEQGTTFHFTIPVVETA